MGLAANQAQLFPSHLPKASRWWVGRRIGAQETEPPGVYVPW
jgi:hypothetical protein